MSQMHLNTDLPSLEVVLIVPGHVFQLVPGQVLHIVVVDVQTDRLFHLEPFHIVRKVVFD